MYSVNLTIVDMTRVPTESYMNVYLDRNNDPKGD